MRERCEGTPDLTRVLWELKKNYRKLSNTFLLWIGNLTKKFTWKFQFKRINFCWLIQVQSRDVARNGKRKRITKLTKFFWLKKTKQKYRNEIRIDEISEKLMKRITKVLLALSRNINGNETIIFVIFFVFHEFSCNAAYCTDALYWNWTHWNDWITIEAIVVNASLSDRFLT